MFICRVNIHKILKYILFYSSRVLLKKIFNDVQFNEAIRYLSLFKVLTYTCFPFLLLHILTAGVISPIISTIE